MDVEPGIIVAGMIHGTLSDRSPLCHLKDFFRIQDTELILGKAVPAENVKDYNVARVLDRIMKWESKEFSANFLIVERPYLTLILRSVTGTIRLSVSGKITMSTRPMPLAIDE